MLETDRFQEKFTKTPTFPPCSGGSVDWTYATRNQQPTRRSRLNLRYVSWWGIPPLLSNPTIYLPTNFLSFDKGPIQSRRGTTTLDLPQHPPQDLQSGHLSITGTSAIHSWPCPDRFAHPDTGTGSSYWLTLSLVKSPSMEKVSP